MCATNPIFAEIGYETYSMNLVDIAHNFNGNCAKFGNSANIYKKNRIKRGNWYSKINFRVWKKSDLQRYTQTIPPN